VSWTKLIVLSPRQEGVEVNQPESGPSRVDHDGAGHPNDRGGTHHRRGPGTGTGVSSAGLAGAIISGAFLAAMVAGAINVWMARRRSREEERARIRGTFAAAFEAYTAYKEFPYAIRRRRADDPEGERIRLSEALRAVQEKLSYYLAWTQAESAEVGQQYAGLVAEARRVAGRAMHDAWNDPPQATDPEMNIPPEIIDLRELEAAEDQYMQAVRDHLSSLTPWWAR
jgi:hypothetical protein